MRPLDCDFFLGGTGVELTRSFVCVCAGYFWDGPGLASLQVAEITCLSHLCHLMVFFLSPPPPVSVFLPPESHVAKNWQQSLSNGQWKTEALIPTVHKEGNTAKLGSRSFSSWAEMAAEPANTRTTACERPKRTHLSYIQIPDLQKLWDIKCWCVMLLWLGVIWCDNRKLIQGYSISCTHFSKFIT
jgi:hypothetical protein